MVWFAYVAVVMPLFLLTIRRRESARPPRPRRRPAPETCTLPEGTPMTTHPLVAAARSWPDATRTASSTQHPSAPGDEGDARALTVESSADACRLSAAEAPAGTLTFDVTNTGDQVTEFYLLAEDGLRIVAEVENIGPSITRALTVNAPAGDYVTACKPGMTGEGIRGDFAVTGSAEDAEVERRRAGAGGAGAGQLRGVRRGPVGPAAGEDRRVRRRSTRPATTPPPGRSTRSPAPHWERIETVAESFGDLDPMMDAREADLEPGQEWTGWHLIEKDLWPQRAEDYARVHEGARDLRRRPARQHRGARHPGAGADLHHRRDRQRLARAARGGRHRQGDRRGGVLVAHRPVGLPGQRRRRPRRVRGRAADRRGEGPRARRAARPPASTSSRRCSTSTARATASSRYDELAPEEVKELSDAVNALSEPLSRLTAAVLS